MTDRTGRQKTREQRMKRRVPELGYYFIVTDTKETEQNYILGLRDSFPAHIQGKLVIKVWKARTVDLVEKALEMASLHPQFGEPWIIFDRDQVPNFDAIITTAQQQGIHVGWSNPCIEIWFHTYFGSMPTHQESVSCCAGFSRKYKHIVDQTYEKADRSIYGHSANSVMRIPRFQSLRQNMQNTKTSASPFLPRCAHVQQFTYS